MNYLKNECMTVPVGKLTNQITKAYVGVLNEELNDLPIDRYFYPLVLLDEFKGAPTQQELADQLDIGKALMVRIVNYLADNNLITRQSGKKDRRCQYIYLTEGGKKLVPTIKKAVEKTNNICFQGFSRSQVQQAENLLDHIFQNLNKHPQIPYQIDISKESEHEK